MTKEETKKVLAVLASNYKTIREALEDKSMADITINTWHSCLADIDYKLCGKAVQKCIMLNKYPPTIHDIRTAVVEITNPKQAEAIDYWQEAFSMMCNANYMTLEEYMEYSEVCRRFFGSVGNLRTYGLMDREMVINNIQPRFLRYIESFINEEKEQALLPQQYKDMVKELSNSFEIKELSEVKVNL